MAPPPSPSSPGHRWQDDERLVLCLLNVLYQDEKVDLLKVFNTIYQRRLADEGRTEGLRLSVFTAMFYQLQVVKNRSEPWLTISQLSLTQIRHKFQKQRNLIEDSAINAGIGLRLKIVKEVKESVFTSRLNRARARPQLPTSRATTPTSTFSDSSGDDSHEGDSGEEETPTKLPRLRRMKTNIESTVHREPPALIKTKLNTSGIQRQYPTLLFRAFDTCHQFNSRKVLKDGSIGQPPPYNSRRFRKAVWPHLNVDTNYSSPFVSFGDGPTNVLNRLRHNPFLSLAIFSFKAVNDDLQSRFADGLYLVKDICKNVHRIEDLPKRYTGSGEWLAWGSITVDPIAIFSASEAMALQAVMRTTKSIDWDTGERVGRRLNVVSAAWREVVAYKLLRAFRVAGYRKGPKGSAYTSFIEGVYSASNARRADSVMSEFHRADSPDSSSPSSSTYGDQDYDDGLHTGNSSDTTLDDHDEDAHMKEISSSDAESDADVDVWTEWRADSEDHPILKSSTRGKDKKRPAENGSDDEKDQEFGLPVTRLVKRRAKNASNHKPTESLADRVQRLEQAIHAQSFLLNPHPVAANVTSGTVSKPIEIVDLTIKEEEDEDEEENPGKIAFA